jgi:hypothetical protein
VTTGTIRRPRRTRAERFRHLARLFTEVAGVLLEEVAVLREEEEEEE